MKHVDLIRRITDEGADETVAEVCVRTRAPPSDFCSGEYSRTGINYFTVNPKVNAEVGKNGMVFR